MTLQNFFFFFFNARELLCCPDQKALQKDVLNHSHLKGNAFSMFKVASLFLWGIPTKGLSLLKEIAGSALLANCLGRESIHQKEFFFYYSLKSVSKQNSAALVEKAFLFLGFFML